MQRNLVAVVRHRSARGLALVCTPPVVHRSARGLVALVRSPHVVLGVEQGASAAQLKAAYRQKAMELHPDRHEALDRDAAEHAFKEVGEAYGQLANGRRGPRAGMSHQEAHELFWEIFGADGEFELAWRVPGRSNRPNANKKPWQQYQLLIASASDEAQLTSGLELRRLYRDCLRTLRGLDNATAAGVREHARSSIARNAQISDPIRIRSLLVEGRHDLDEMASCLGTAVVRRDVTEAAEAAPARRGSGEEAG